MNTSVFLALLSPQARVRVLPEPIWPISISVDDGPIIEIRDRVLDPEVYGTTLPAMEFANHLV